MLAARPVVWKSMATEGLQQTLLLLSGLGSRSSLSVRFAVRFRGPFIPLEGIPGSPEHT